MKINLVMKKEDIDTDMMDETKIAVVLDILMATTSITASLAEGAECVIPVLNESEARAEQENHTHQDVCLAGEMNGLVIDGFHNPVPTSLCPHVRGKKVILSTTNGTVAIRAAAQAKSTYIASLLNGKAVAEAIVKHYQEETVLVICSGSSNQFCLEDFYGAGYLITELMSRVDRNQLDLTNSARGAALFYEGLSDQAVKVLSDSNVGHMLIKAGFINDIEFTSKKGIVDLAPQLIENRIIV